MRSLIFIYEAMAEWEAVPVSFLLSGLGKVDTFGFERKPMKGISSLYLIPELTTGEVEPGKYDVLIIPGGDYGKFRGRKDLFEIIREFDRAGKVIGAICGGPAALFWAGVLKNRFFTASLEEGEIEGLEFAKYVDEYAVRDGSIVTGKGEGFTEFALKVGEALGAADTAARNEFINLFRHA